MLAKTVERGADWDERLPYVLFAYRASEHASTGQSPFMLLYGRDPQLPSQLNLAPSVHRETVDITTYKSTVVQEMNEAWSTAKSTLEKAQGRQKQQHDKSAQNAEFQVGEQVFVLMPALRSGPAYKLSRPYKGPYRILRLYPNGADLQSIEHPWAQTIRVALNRGRRFPQPRADERETGNSDESNQNPDPTFPDTEPPEPFPEVTAADTGVVEELPPQRPSSRWTGRLRPRQSRGRAAS